MVAVVWVLGVALVVVFRPFSSAFSAIVDNDVAAATASSGRETRACGACRGAIARPCRVWRLFREVWGSFEVGAAAMVAVVNVVDVVDGGCVGVDGGDVAASIGSLGGDGVGEVG